MNVLEEYLQRQKQQKTVSLWLPGHCGAWYPPYREYLNKQGASNQFESTDELQILLKETSLALGLAFYDEISHPLAAGRYLGMNPVSSNEGVIGYESLIYSPSQIQNLAVREEEIEIKKALDSDLENMIGILRHVGPFTMTGYLIEGQAEWQPRFRTLLFQYPTQARILLQKATDAIIQWVEAQHPFHKKVLLIDETWSDLIQPEDQDVFITPWLEYLITKLPNTPIILKASGLEHEIKRFYKAGLSAFIPDMHVNFDEIRQQTAYSMILATPFDSGRLLSTPAVIKQTAGRYLERVGCEDVLVTLHSEPLPHTSLAQIQAWIEAIHTYSCD